ncbi:TIGR04283 family arsenosugar biosynthesis glycosyltransferase [Facklamia sp. 7083-14-GEN3]|uniref:TIGR04283 family arsenosugar biosynthesis glycosyltransferase n=1 Tax=Facklamia sp. 7083-14-GEN3 TaxID=2973478 RepID=UPI00215B90FE|nr:TIGR04283 family arsenosugar biosynthesis glycosyltransferase [Facklamia sp. 7083-14-GEN3]MCR8968569.1 TIGR04283 family arsenosugar biosynthesis glycosyltransferase [Facklamia sp. 7083-14-GEN3]
MTYIISVIIPVYNEMKILPETLKNLQHLKDEDIEILFVDGGSEDGTQDFLRKNQYKILHSPKGRGSQLAVGAEKARGDYLLFLHADSYFNHSPKKVILNSLLKGKIGAFPLNFQTDNLWLRAIAKGSNWRLKHRQIAFGDQGIFMTKDYYRQLGGFLSLPLMEDYDLSLRNKARGEKLIIANQFIYTSDRRFKEKGVFRTLFKMQHCQYLFRKGCAMKEITQVYYS